MGSVLLEGLRGCRPAPGVPTPEVGTEAEDDEDASSNQEPRQGAVRGTHRGSSVEAKWRMEALSEFHPWSVLRPSPRAFCVGALNMRNATCKCEALLSEENVRKAFETRKPLSDGTVYMIAPWQEAVSPEGKPSVSAKFDCALCGQTHTVTVEIEGEPRPDAWWRA